jgi:hypothetical protein
MQLRMQLPRTALHALALLSTPPLPPPPTPAPLSIAVPVTFAFNATAELAEADALVGNTGLVRVFQAAWAVASQNAPLAQLPQVQTPWAPASSASLPGFSATAWYTAKALLTGRTGADAAVPLGIVVSTWPGTPIKPWTPPGVNAGCMPLYPLNGTHADCGMFHWCVRARGRAGGRRWRLPAPHAHPPPPPPPSHRPLTPLQAVQRLGAAQLHGGALPGGPHEGGRLRVVPGCVTAVVARGLQEGCEPRIFNWRGSVMSGTPSSPTHPPTHPRPVLLPHTAGENDCTQAEVASGYYSCQLTGLAAAWRAGFASPGASWSTVQLNAWFLSGDHSVTLADFRAMQAATTAGAASGGGGEGGVGRAHVARIFDLGDATSPLGSVHSRNKQATGVRVAAGIRALVYGEAGVPTVGPTYAGATYASGADGSLVVTVAFAPGTADGGLAYAPPAASPWGNATRCPSDVQRNADQYCAWPAVLASDGMAYNASAVSVGPGGDTLVLTATGAPAGVAAVGSAFAWGDWPVVNFYGARSGLPLVPWFANGSYVVLG